MEKFVKFSDVRVGDTFVTEKYGEHYRFIKVIRSNGKFGAVPESFAIPYDTVIACADAPAFSDCSHWNCRIVESFCKASMIQRRELTERNEIKKQNITNINKEYAKDKKIPVVVGIENGYTIIYVSFETAKCLQYLIDKGTVDSDYITINPPMQTF